MGAAPSPKPGASHNKLSRLPSGYRISKRPLLHPSIPSPRSSSDKIIYISTKTPFISAVKRVQKLLDHADAREAQSALAAAKARPGKKKSKDGTGAGLEEDYVGRAAGEIAAKQGGEAEGQVVLKGTGRAIEKTLSIAVMFQQRQGYRVVVKTGSVGTIDDILETEEGATGEDSENGKEEAGTAGDVPTSRVRFTSVLEARISRDL